MLQTLMMLKAGKALDLMRNAEQGDNKWDHLNYKRDAGSNSNSCN